MGNDPEISVVIVGYNQGEYIREALRSVLGQTFQGFEVIVVDDGSTDNTKEVTLSFGDDRIRYYNQGHTGLPACGRNTGMSMSKGKYIALMDGDDYWLKEKLEKSKVALDEAGDAGLVCHNENIVYDGKIMRTTSYGPYVGDMYHRLLFVGNCLHPSAVTLRKEVFFRDGVKFCEDPDLCTIEDYEYWLRLSQRYRFVFLQDVLGFYRVTETGVFLGSGDTNTANMLRLLDSHFNAVKELSASAKRDMRIRRSAVMSAAGRMYHHKNDFYKSMDWYSKAIAEYPLNYKPYLGFLAAALHFRIIYR